MTASSAGDTPGSSQEADTDAANLVCAAFGCERPVAVTRITTGYLNRDEVATFATGERLFLKGSRHDDPRVVLAEHAVIRHAAGMGIPTPVPLQAPDGSSVVVVDGVPWSAFPFVAGTPLASENAPETLGHLLARTHRALSGCATDDLIFAEGDLVWDTAETLREMIEIEAHITARRAAGRADPFDTFTLEAFARLRDILAEALSPADFATLPRQVIHGDCYPANILCQPPGEPVALLDWEFATVRPRIWDLVRTLAFTFLGVHGTPPDLDATRRCVAAYRQLRPLDDGELVAGIALYHWRTAHNIVKYRWHDQRGPQPTDALAWGDLALTQWLHRHGQTFARYLSRTGPAPPAPTAVTGAIASQAPGTKATE